MSENTHAGGTPDPQNPYGSTPDGVPPQGPPQPGAPVPPGSPQPAYPPPPGSPEPFPSAPPVSPQPYPPAQPGTPGAPPAPSGTGAPGYPPPGPQGAPQGGQGWGPGYPPPGQPGQPQGAYPPPGAGYQPYGQGQVQVGEAFSYGWARFTQNVGVILGAALIYIGAFAVVTFVFFLALIGFGSSTDDYESMSSGSAAGFGITTVLFVLIIIMLSFLVQAGIIRGALVATQGRPLVLKDFFQFTNLGTVIATALLVGLATSLLSITFIGGIIFSFFAQFALYFVIDKGLGPIDAIKASFDLAYRNLSVTVLLFVGVYLCEAIGALLCGIGLLVSMPVALIATAYTYRRLIGEQPI